MKTVIIDIYTRYKITLCNENRIKKQPWEGPDLMSEVEFEPILARDDGERVEIARGNSIFYLNRTIRVKTAFDSPKR